MRGIAPAVILLCALVAALFSLFGDDSFDRMQSLERSLIAQQSKNSELHGKVRNLKEEVFGLQHDDRVLEKAARNELGMARPSEMVFIFDSVPEGHDDHK